MRLANYFEISILLSLYFLSPLFLFSQQVLADNEPHLIADYIHVGGDEYRIENWFNGYGLLLKNDHKIDNISFPTLSKAAFSYLGKWRSKPGWKYLYHQRL